MLQFYNNLNRTIIKHNTIYGNTINLLCDDVQIGEKLNNLYNTIQINTDLCLKDIKPCLTIICTNEIYDDNIVKCINSLVNKKIKICLIVKLDFNFNKLVKNVIANDIEAISWIENDKKYEYYLINI